MWNLLKSPKYDGSLSLLGSLALKDLAWDKSRFSGVPGDRLGICPWFTYAAIEMLDQIVVPNARVLEIGSGLSTVWWALRGGKVYSIEASEAWAYRTMEIAKTHGVGSQIEVVVCNDIESALSEIHFASGKFDVVVNDGLEPRGKLGDALVSKLDKGGIFVWDNSERVEYEQALLEMRQKGFWEIEFFGMGPINPYAWQTSLLGRNTIEVLGRRRSS